MSIKFSYQKSYNVVRLRKESERRMEKVTSVNHEDLHTAHTRPVETR